MRGYEHENRNVLRLKTQMVFDADPLTGVRLTKRCILDQVI